MANPPPMILQSMTAKVLEEAQRKNSIKKDSLETLALYADRIYKYAKFLTMPLELGFFVPVDKDGNVLEEPIETIGGVEMYATQFQQAKNNVIFEGFEKCDRQESFYCLYNEKLNLHIPISFEFNKNIESLVKYGLTITETAIKKYGL